jgi:hypothetical protein
MLESDALQTNVSSCDILSDYEPDCQEKCFPRLIEHMEPYRLDAPPLLNLGLFNLQPIVQGA